jgi:hypothetical protein
MDKWSAALTAIGGLAAVGGLIDLALYRSEKEKLKALLEDWWLRFTDVRWSNFGRVEAELAVQILDRWAGPRLWSWKRAMESIWLARAAQQSHQGRLRHRHSRAHGRLRQSLPIDLSIWLPANQ